MTELVSASFFVLTYVVSCSSLDTTTWKCDALEQMSWSSHVPIPEWQSREMGCVPRQSRRYAQLPARKRLLRNSEIFSIHEKSSEPALAVAVECHNPKKGNSGPAFCGFSSVFSYVDGIFFAYFIVILF